MKVKTIAEVIENLKGYNQDELIAVNWWLDIDFEEYEDKAQALKLVQDYLNALNPDIQAYVDDYYKGKRAE
jgi:hypothetical protein